MAITLKKQRRLLQFFSALFLLSGFFFVWLASQKPSIGSLRLQESLSKNHSIAELAPFTKKTIDPTSSHWKKRLRNPLYDPPPPPPKVAEKKELPPLRAKLLGTILEPGGSKAMVELPGNVVKFLSVGEPLGAQDPEAVVDAINSNSILVKRGEITNELTVDRGY